MTELKGIIKEQDILYSDPRKIRLDARKLKMKADKEALHSKKQLKLIKDSLLHERKGKYEVLKLSR